MANENLRRQLHGRRSECDALDQLASGVEAGHSAVLVLRGEAGIGKSALLEYLAQRASGYRIARGAGVESEMELPFAGLHQLCAPFLGRIDRLPGPQAEALATAFGLSTGPPPDRFLVGLAVLSLLSDVATEQPLFCLVDDAQWLDRVSAQTLAFVARRMLAEPLALVFAFRELQEHHEFAGLPDLTVEGLQHADARALLDSAIRGPVDERVRDRIVAEARGNPLALLEFPRGLTATELAGGFGLPNPGTTVGHIEQSYLRQVQSLPSATQRLLLAAAAEPVGDVILLWRAVERLGIDPGAAAAAQAAGMLDIGALVRFRHPLLRSAVYRSADLAERRETHRVLAEVTDPTLDPDRRAWHRALAAVGPDQAIAAELESSAGRAQSRGGAAAAAAFLVRATVLTPDPRRRAARAVAAAQAKLRAGAPDGARELLAVAEVGPLDELQQARVGLLRAQIAFASSRGTEACPLLLAAARRLVPLDAGLARETFLDAILAAMYAGSLGGGSDVRAVAAAIREIPPVARAPRNADLLLDSLVLRFTEGYSAAAAASQSALRSLDWDTDAGEVMRWCRLAIAVAGDMWDDQSWSELATRHVKTARAIGALGELPLALSSAVLVHVFVGELDAAALLVAEIAAVNEVAGGGFVSYGALGLAAWQGDELIADALIQAKMKDAVARGEGVGVTVAQWARAVLYNGLGKYEQAFAAASRASAHTQDVAVANWGLTELVEAGVRSGERSAAVAALGRLAEMTDAAGTEWALGAQARSRALVSEGCSAERLYREAIERLGRTRMRVELARAHLVYGEWLRRENRRGDARAQLRSAHGMFSGFGARAFTERAARELQATGETVAKRTIAAPTTLTSQEAQIARLARDGLTNPEIGAQLFISPHTVEWHLRKVFAKLGITSRRQLRTTLTDRSATTPPA
ncbi:helix-turn-helix transcriptional regulator [Streptomyces cavernae]|uniref:helix-turn-helix transcriptional regulator n=1 Tax=Streptomyces cavernae TaxID=2259034 RepID=UPI000FEBF228|nr:LuxR family transcriptional regulator [Streptomyces cavernae]